MRDNYAKIAQHNLDRLYKNLPDNLAENLTGKQEGDRFVFHAFGETCVISSAGIFLGRQNHSSDLDILISLYIFYEHDEDFPASVTCLFSHNARLFLPVDGLADVGEYTSRKILEIIG